MQENRNLLLKTFLVCFFNQTFYLVEMVILLILITNHNGRKCWFGVSLQFFSNQKQRQARFH